MTANALDERDLVCREANGAQEATRGDLAVGLGAGAFHLDRVARLCDALELGRGAAQALGPESTDERSCRCVGHVPEGSPARLRDGWMPQGSALQCDRARTETSADDSPRGSRSTAPAVRRCT